ncbi:30S ribosomal protein S6 [Sodalis sp. CWE]|uniref:30S ribosomal protein S6 n=1 Tax=Sodalis sp. CWE TaxID=2803816 RepID=UPI001C7D8715|nr:30S ribosomal protein S6 [Sodalis sp. CWE]
MRHYEVIFMVHPDHSEQVEKMIDHYKTIINNVKGQIHRLENLGRRHLAYPIKKLHKAHYVLMNIEIPKTIINEIKLDLQFNEAIIRSMITCTKFNILEPSPMNKIKNEQQEISNHKTSSVKFDENINRINL